MSTKKTHSFSIDIVFKRGNKVTARITVRDTKWFRHELRCANRGDDTAELLNPRFMSTLSRQRLKDIIHRWDNDPAYKQPGIRRILEIQEGFRRPEHGRESKWYEILTDQEVQMFLQEEAALPQATHLSSTDSTRQMVPRPPAGIRTRPSSEPREMVEIFRRIYEDWLEVAVDMRPERIRHFKDMWSHVNEEARQMVKTLTSDAYVRPRAYGDSLQTTWIAFTCSSEKNNQEAEAASGTQHDLGHLERVVRVERKLDLPRPEENPDVNQLHGEWLDVLNSAQVMDSICTFLDKYANSSHQTRETVMDLVFGGDISKKLSSRAPMQECTRQPRERQWESAPQAVHSQRSSDLDQVYDDWQQILDSGRAETAAQAFLTKYASANDEIRSIVRELVYINSSSESQKLMSHKGQQGQDFQNAPKQNSLRTPEKSSRDHHSGLVEPNSPLSPPPDAFSTSCLWRQYRHTELHVATHSTPIKTQPSEEQPLRSRSRSSLAKSNPESRPSKNSVADVVGKYEHKLGVPKLSAPNAEPPVQNAGDNSSAKPQRARNGRSRDTRKKSKQPEVSTTIRSPFHIPEAPGQSQTDIPTAHGTRSKPVLELKEQGATTVEERRGAAAGGSSHTNTGCLTESAKYVASSGFLKHRSSEKQKTTAVKDQQPSHAERSIQPGDEPPASILRDFDDCTLEEIDERQAWWRRDREQIRARREARKAASVLPSTSEESSRKRTSDTSVQTVSETLIETSTYIDANSSPNPSSSNSRTGSPMVSPIDATAPSDTSLPSVTMEKTSPTVPGAWESEEDLDGSSSADEAELEVYKATTEAWYQSWQDKRQQKPIPPQDKPFSGCPELLKYFVRKEGEERLQTKPSRTESEWDEVRRELDEEVEFHRPETPSTPKPLHLRKRGLRTESSMKSPSLLKHSGGSAFCGSSKGPRVSQSFAKSSMKPVIESDTESDIIFGVQGSKGKGKH